MKLFRKVMSGLLAGSLILSLVACGAGSGATETGDPSGNGAVGTSSASGDEIVVNVSDNVTLINLEVYANNNSCEFLYADLVFDPLYYGDRQGNNSPCICTSYDLNEDGTEVTLHIKEGVKFHDGTDLNAEDVVATFEFMLRNMDTLGLASAVWSNLESVELIDEYTCKITLSQYFATFENSLTYTWILSDEDIEQYGIAAPHDLLYTEAVRRDPRKLRIAYMTRTPYGKPFVSPECVEAVLSVVDILRALGHTCVEAYPEISEQYHDARVMYMNDGIVLEIQQMAEETGCPIDETTLEPLVYKTYLDALSRKGMEVFRARRELARAGREMGRFFQSYDLLISPTCGRIGRPLGTLNGVVNSEISASEWARKRRDYACIAPLANVAGLPSISLPLYMSDSGLPIGVEIDGAIDQDELVLQLSAQLERAAPWSERKPPIYVSEI